MMLGASSRAAIHLMSATKAHARLEGREAASIEDARAMAPFVLTHRLIIEDEDVRAEDVLALALEQPIGF
jgi:MoxR-like ATPase